MEQAVSRRKKVKIIMAPTYDDSRAKIALWNDPHTNMMFETVMHRALQKVLAYFNSKQLTKN